MRRSAHWMLRVGGVVMLSALLLAVTVVYLNIRGENDAVDNTPLSSTDTQPMPSVAQIDHGRYLAQVGNCAGCHNNPGATPYAGGRALRTPFGTVYSSNLTPDPATGIGDWSPAQFWRAMHYGRGRDGHLLNPVFPYTSYTHVTREDSDAIYAFLRSLTPAVHPNRAHALRFPYNTQAALAVWRALYFRAADPVAETRADAARSTQWVRGAYLARGLGHCVECHSSRNALGAISGSLELAGGAIPSQGWYAPSLASPDEAGVARWKREDVVSLLKTGQAPGASVIGPMAEVVYGSTQHWSDPDLQAVAEFLQALPAGPARPPSTVNAASTAAFTHGSKIYERDCASCHGPAGQGAPGIYPALAGNRAVTMGVTINLVHIVRSGGFAPATAGNPRPYGMPPFGQTLSDAEIASVLTFVRQSWGNRAAPVSELDALQQGRSD
jgi:mono/diheme cytochrome c family protein